MKVYIQNIHYESMEYVRLQAKLVVQGQEYLNLYRYLLIFTYL